MDPENGFKEVQAQFMADLQKRMPKSDVPIFYKIKGKCYPQKLVMDAVLKVTTDMIHRIIETSEHPKSVFKRIASFQNPQGKTIVWTEAFKRVMKMHKGKTAQEIQKETKKHCHIVDLDELDKEAKMDITKIHLA